MFKTLNGKPDIAYPCMWTFKLFGKDQEAIRLAVARALPESEYALTLSNSSSHKRYHCMNLDINVVSEKKRDEIYEKLSNSKDILLIL